MGNIRKVSLEVGVDMLVDFRDAIDAHINDKINSLLESYPGIDVSFGIEKALEVTKDDAIKSELNKIHRLEKMSEKLYYICDKLNPPEEDS